MWTFGKYLDAEIHPNACHPTQSNGRGFATYNSRKTIPFQRHLIQLDVLWYFFSCIGSGSVKVRTALRPAPLRLGANSNPLPKKIMSAGSSLNTSAVGCCRPYRPYRRCPIIGLVGSCNACSSYLNFLSDMILYQKIFQNHLDRSLVQPHWTWSDGLSMSQWIYRRYILIYIYIYWNTLNLNLRRGGTKASACFLTRAGARETPPHPYGMAQTWSAPTSTIAIGS